VGVAADVAAYPVVAVDAMNSAARVVAAAIRRGVRPMWYSR
jgi:hypothetical protein